MRIHRHSFLALALALASASAWGQPASADPASKIGIPPPNAPPGLPPSAPPAPTKGPDAAGQEQPGAFAPGTSETVVAPPFTPATPGVTPIDTPTKATVGAAPSDTAMRDSIVAALAADPALQGAKVNVSVHGGVVNLTGTARDPAQVDRVLATVGRIAGPSNVKTNISATG
jgi:hypothetical protein